VNGRSWGFNVSETRSPLVVVHPQIGDLSPAQANTTEALPGRHLVGQGRRQCHPAAQPGRVTCGNGEGSGQDGAPGQGRTAAAALPGARLRTARRQPPAAAGSSRPGDLATELNPHETELNPHRAVPGDQPHKGRPTRCLPCRAVRWAAAHDYQKGSGA
jgi:hypothetical protein